MKDQLASKIIAIVASVTRRPPEEIRPDATFEELGIDSLDRINVLFELEGEFNISIPDEDARAVTTVNGIAERLEIYLQRAESKGA